MKTASPRPAFFGPAMAVLVALGLASATLSYYGDYALRTLDRTGLETQALKMVKSAVDDLQLAHSAASDGITCTLITATVDDPRYPYLRRYTSKDGEPVSRALINLWIASRKSMVSQQTARETQVAIHRSASMALVLTKPRQTAALGFAYGWLFVVSLIGGAVWWFCTQRSVNARWLSIVGPATMACGLVAVLSGAVWTFSPHEPLTSTEVWGAHLYGLFALPIIPLVWMGILGWVNGGGVSPHRRAYRYIAPAFIGLAVLVLLPFFFGVGLAFFKYSQGQFTWIGVGHFWDILGNHDYGLTHPLNFYFTLGVTVLWTALNVGLHLTIGLSLALLLNQPNLKFKGIYRVLLIVPWAVPSYITALVWKGMFNHQFGVINAALNGLGMDGVDWFGQFSTAFAANVATNTWLGFPFMMVVALGALQSIPKDLYEAAEVDGASGWQSFRSITLPLLRPALLPAVIMGSVWTFNMFNIVYLVSGGRPDGSTDILITEAYRWAFERERYGYAAAYSVVIFVVLIAYSALTQRAGRGSEVST